MAAVNAMLSLQKIFIGDHNGLKQPWRNDPEFKVIYAIIKFLLHTYAAYISLLFYEFNKTSALKYTVDFFLLL